MDKSHKTRRGFKLVFTILAILLVIILVAAVWYLRKAIPIGTGYAAKYLCSSTFISQREPHTVWEEEIKPINPLSYFIKWKINMDDSAVTASAFGIKSKAIYRRGCGCTLMSGAAEEELRQQAFFQRPDSKAVKNSELPWPQGDGDPINPQSLGINPEPLDRALNYAFSEPSPDHPRKTRALLVVYVGNLILEHYAPGFCADTPILGWSMTKSLTNALVGILVQKGELDIYKRAPVPEWSDPADPRHHITTDQLLRMSSGLAFQEVYQPLFDATKMLYRSSDFAAYAAQKELNHPPDSVWNYSSGSANIVARIVRQRAETLYDPYYDFLNTELFHKIGMTSALIEPDPSGTFVGSSYGFATPRDWVRFALFYLQDGVWNGERILPEEWVKYSTTPTPNAPMGEYGAMFWLNAGAPGNPEHRKWPDAPIDMFVAQGYMEQRVMMIPSKKLIVVRFGATADKEAWDSNEFLKLLLPAFP